MPLENSIYYIGVTIILVIIGALLGGDYTFNSTY
ncbi:hypothetical protein IG9_05552 [Bacillus cereus HuA2-9]|nr:hypothetical protein IG9_05552 [Bacillus cereus HuA2-9]